MRLVDYLISLPPFGFLNMLEIMWMKRYSFFKSEFLAYESSKFFSLFVHLVMFEIEESF